MELEGYEDLDLIQEIAYTGYEEDDLDEILTKTSLTLEEREKLEWIYVLYYAEDFLVIAEEGEW